jgi:hypothetical protein
MVAVLQQIGLVLLYLLIFLVNLLIFAGVPGGWISLAIIFVYDLASGFDVVGWHWWLVIVLLLATGEVIEAFLGSYVASRKGASRWGAFGALAGGIAGAIAGTAAIPVIGGIVFALVNIGFWAFVGKLWAFIIKYALAAAMLVIFIFRSWR